MSSKYEDIYNNNIGKQSNISKLIDTDTKKRSLIEWINNYKTRCIITVLQWYSAAMTCTHRLDYSVLLVI